MEKMVKFAQKSVCLKKAKMRNYVIFNCHFAVLKMLFVYIAHAFEKEILHRFNSNRMPL